MRNIRRHINYLAIAALMVIGALQIGLMAHDADKHSAADQCLICKIEHNGYSAPPVAHVLVMLATTGETVNIFPVASRVRAMIAPLPPSRAPPFISV